LDGTEFCNTSVSTAHRQFGFPRRGPNPVSDGNRERSSSASAVSLVRQPKGTRVSRSAAGDVVGRVGLRANRGEKGAEPTSAAIETVDTSLIEARTDASPYRRRFGSLAASSADVSLDRLRAQAISAVSSDSERLRCRCRTTSSSTPSRAQRLEVGLGATSRRPVRSGLDGGPSNDLNYPRRLQLPRATSTSSTTSATSTASAISTAPGDFNYFGDFQTTSATSTALGEFKLLRRLQLPSADFNCRRLPDCHGDFQLPSDFDCFNYLGDFDYPRRVNCLGRLQLPRTDFNCPRRLRLPSATFDCLAPFGTTIGDFNCPRRLATASATSTASVIRLPSVISTASAISNCLRPIRLAVAIF